MRTRIPRWPLLVLALLGLLVLAAPARADLLLGVDDDNQLHRLILDGTGSDTAVNITGLQMAEAIVGIDLRPQTNQLYGLGKVGDTGRLYLINMFTGAATQVGPTTMLDGTSFGVDFNPVADRLRVVSDAGQNLRINPNDGIVTTDTPLQYAMGDPNENNDPNVVASAYTNNFFGATTTTLYGIDEVLNILSTQNPPNSGTLSSGPVLDGVVPPLTAFDLFDNGQAFASTAGASSSTVFRVDPVTGGMTPVRTVSDVLVGVTGEPTGAAGPFSGILNRAPDPFVDFVVRNDGMRPVEFLAGELASGYAPVSADIMSGPDANCFVNQGFFNCGPFAGPGYWAPGQEIVIRVETDPRYADNGGVQLFVCAVPCAPFGRDAGPFGFGGPSVVIIPPGGNGGPAPNGNRLPGDFDLNGAVDAADYIVWRKGVVNEDGLRVRIQTPEGVLEGDATELYNEWRTNFGRRSASQRAGAAQRRRRKPVVFARNRTTLRGEDSKRIRIRLTKAGRRLVRGYGRKRLRGTLILRVTYRPASGAPAQRRTFRQKVTLRVQRKRR